MPFVKDFVINYACTLFFKLQTNDPVEKFLQSVQNIFKGLSNRVFVYKYPWGEIYTSVSRVIIDSYCCTLQVTQVQSVFVIYVVFKLTSIINYHAIAVRKSHKCIFDRDYKISYRVRYR